MNIKVENNLLIATVDNPDAWIINKKYKNNKNFISKSIITDINYDINSNFEEIFFNKCIK